MPEIVILLGLAEGWRRHPFGYSSWRIARRSLLTAVVLAPIATVRVVQELLADTPSPATIALLALIIGLVVALQTTVVAVAGYGLARLTASALRRPA